MPGAFSTAWPPRGSQSTTRRSCLSAGSCLLTSSSRASRSRSRSNGVMSSVTNASVSSMRDLRAANCAALRDPFGADPTRLLARGGRRRRRHDVVLGALDDRVELAALALGHAELREGLVEVVHERIPLRAGDEQLAVRVEHRAPRVGLRAARRPANLLGDVVLETLGRDAVVRLVDSRVRVQPRVDHDPIDEVVDDDGDGVHASQPLVQRLRFSRHHRPFLASDRVRAHDFAPFPRRTSPLAPPSTSSSPRLSCGQAISGTRRWASANSKSHSSSTSAATSWLPVALILSNWSLFRSLASTLSKVAEATPRPDVRSTSRLPLQKPSSSLRAGRIVIL